MFSGQSGQSVFYPPGAGRFVDERIGWVRDTMALEEELRAEHLQMILNLHNLALVEEVRDQSHWNDGLYSDPYKARFWTLWSKLKDDSLKFGVQMAAP